MQLQAINAAQRSRDWSTRIRDGDAGAEHEFIEFYTRGIRLLLLRKTGQPAIAHDLCQDTFVVALRRLRAGELKNPEALSAFVRQVAVNLAIDYFRREKRYVRQDDEVISLHTSLQDYAAEELDIKATRDLLESALAELNVDRDREILRRYYLYDEDKALICSDLELSAAHFDRVLYRARQRMRSLIESKGLKQQLFGGLSDG